MLSDTVSDAVLDEHYNCIIIELQPDLITE